ncbi:MAG TPA: hypothetical protein VG389_09635 [Myxococcota bacterium]|jgi:DNA-binding NarL/FixJ family response regulator|nr:hypothetical protein [Myxococcota bacterium]
MQKAPVLLLDDDDAFRGWYASALHDDLGVDVAVAANVGEARQVLERGGESVRVAVVDYQLADGERGFDLLPDLRPRGIFTFGLSGYASADLALAAVHVGCRWFYPKSKPHLDLLMCAIAAALRGDLDEEPVEIPQHWGLPKRAAEVTALSFKGLKTENIAVSLEIEEPTVRRHRAEVLERSGLPYWELVLAFLRTWQTPRAPHGGGSREGR